MKTAARLAAAILALALAFAAVPAAHADVGAISSFCVNPYGGGGSDPETVSWIERDGEYYIFLPADANVGALTVYVRASADVFAGRVRLADGETTFAFRRGGTFTLTCDGEEYTLHIIKGAESVPALFITTQSGSMSAVHGDKSHREPGALTVREPGGEPATLALEYIKGRGNSTWSAEKKPYTFKLESKYDLFGMGAAKKWVLLASVYDRSFLRNAIALDLGAAIGIEFTPQYRFVDLWTNGEYRGLYVLCEKVEVKKNRVEIADLEDANEKANPGVDPDEAPQLTSGDRAPGSTKWIDLENDPKNITGGYLLEFDFQSRYDSDRSGFESPRGQNVALASPQNATKAEVDYISAYYAEAEDALYSPTGFNGAGRHYSEYFDLPSLAKSFILNEYTKNFDGGQSSFYIYKKENGGKLVAGPPWDYDLALGNSGTKVGLQSFDPKGWFAAVLYYSPFDATSADQEMVDTVLASLWRRSDVFRELVRREWLTMRDTVGDGAIAAVEAKADAISASVLMNLMRWGYYPDLSGEEKLDGYRNDTASLTRFMRGRQKALDAAFGADGAMILYDPGEGSGRAVDGTMYAAGDAAEVKPKGSPTTGLIAPSDGREFAGWNTKRDGTGAAYRAGDEIILPAGVTVLYAQWAAANDPRVEWAQTRADGADATIAEAQRLWETLRATVTGAFRREK